MRRYLIRGIKKEYTPFLTSIQGWANQPSIVELENLLTNQEALVMQMAKASISENKGITIIITGGAGRHIIPKERLTGKGGNPAVRSNGD